MLGKLLADDSIEVLVDHALVEAVDLQFNLVRCVEQLNLLSARVVSGDLLVDFPFDAAFAQFGTDAQWRFVVDQIAVEDRLSIAVLVDGQPSFTAKDFDGVNRRRCRQADLNGVKVFDDTRVFGDVVRFVSESQFAIG